MSDKLTAAIEELLRRNLRQIGVHPAVDLHILADGLVGLSHADVERIARDAAKEMLLTEPGPVTPMALERSSARQRKRTAVANGGEKSKPDSRRVRSRKDPTK